MSETLSAPMESPKPGLEQPGEPLTYLWGLPEDGESIFDNGEYQLNIDREGRYDSDELPRLTLTVTASGELIESFTFTEVGVESMHFNINGRGPRIVPTPGNEHICHPDTEDYRRQLHLRAVMVAGFVQQQLNGGIASGKDI